MYDLSLEQRLRQFEPRFPQQHLDLLECLKDIINHDYTKVSRWTKACALHALPVAAPDRVIDELIANLFNPDPLHRETAAWAIYSTDSAAYERHIERLPDDIRRELDGTIKAIQSGDRNGRKPTLGIEKVFALRKSDLFSHISETILAELIPFFDEVALESGDIISPGEMDGKLYIIIQGGVQVRKGEEESALLGEGDAVGEIASPEVDAPPDSITATEPTRLLSIDQLVLCSFIDDHIEAARGIAHVINPPSLEADAAEIEEF
jgi:CRP-like cAMP-binding protein